MQLILGMYIKGVPKSPCLSYCPPLLANEMQIYNEEVRDLLGTGEKKDKLELKEDPTKGVYVKVKCFSNIGGIYVASAATLRPPVGLEYES